MDGRRCDLVKGGVAGGAEGAGSDLGGGVGGGEGLTVEGSSREINGDKIPVTFDGTGQSSDFEYI